MPSQQASSSCCINPHLFFQLHGWVVTRAYIHLWCDRRSDGSCLGGKAGGGRHGDSLPYSIFPGPSLPPAPESPLERPSWDGDAGRMLPAPLVQPAPFTQLDARAREFTQVVQFHSPPPAPRGRGHTGRAWLSSLWGGRLGRDRARG